MSERTIRLIELVAMILLVAGGFILLGGLVQLTSHEPAHHTFTTQDGTTIEWIGDTCQVVEGGALVCTERA